MAAAAAAGAVALILLPILAFVSAAELARSLAYATASVQAGAAPLAHVGSLLGKAAVSFASPLTVPMWALAVLAAVPRAGSRLRAAALVALPVAAALPGAVHLAQGDHFSFGVFAPSWLLLFTAAAAVPAISDAVRREHDTPAPSRLLALAAPASLVGAATVAWVTNSSWNRAMIMVALAPLTLAVLIGWGSMLRRLGSEAALVAGEALALVAAGALLTATVWAEFPGWTTVRVNHGAYAGIAVTDRRRAQLLELEAAGRAYVSPHDKVLFLGEPEGYLLVGGVIDTPSVWIVPGPVDRIVLSHLEESGSMPDVVFVDELGVRRLGGWSAATRIDPLIGRVNADYTRVGPAGGFVVFKRR